MYSPLQFSSSLGSVLQYRLEFHPLFLHQHQILFFYSPSQKKIKSHPSFNFLNVYREKRESRKIKRRISKYSLLSRFDIRLLSPFLPFRFRKPRLLGSSRIEKPKFPTCRPCTTRFHALNDIFLSGSDTVATPRVFPGVILRCNFSPLPVRTTDTRAAHSTWNT